MPNYFYYIVEMFCLLFGPLCDISSYTISHRQKNLCEPLEITFDKSQIKRNDNMQLVSS